MEKEFVPYELALELEQLGFDERCFGYYNVDPQLKSPAFNMAKPFEHEWCLPAPTYSQAFRWFREKHGLLSLTDHKTSHGWFYRVYFGDNEWYGGFVKYKEAELACLIKLISIVEQQKQK